MRAITHTVRFTDFPRYETPFDVGYACSLVGMVMMEEVIKAISEVKNIEEGVKRAFNTIEWITVVESAVDGCDIDTEDVWQYTSEIMDWVVEQVIHHDFDYLLEPVTVAEVYIYPAYNYGKLILFIKDIKKDRTDNEEKKQCHHTQLLLTHTR